MNIKNTNNENYQLMTMSIVILAIIALSFTLYYSRSILIPFVFAVFIRFLIAPIVDFQMKKLKVYRFVAIPIAILFLIAFFLITIPPIYASFLDFLNRSNEYQEKFNLLINPLIILLQDKFDLEYNSLTLQNIFSKYLSYEIISNIFSQTTNFFKTTSIIFVILIFLLLGENDKRKTRTWYEIDKTIKKYISTKFLTSLATSILFGLTYWFFKLDLALIFAFLTFFLSFIPVFGGVIAILLPIPIALIQYDNYTTLVLILIIPTCINFIIGNFIETKILGSALSLSPVTIILALIFWGMLWGFIGIFLAVPLTAIIKILFDQFETTKTFARVLQGNIHLQDN